MSNSELFHIKDDKEDLSNNNLKALKRPMLMFHIQDKEDYENIKEETSSREQDKVENEEENDGFKTPTHIEHRIPIAKQCPLAPRKPKPYFKRRKQQSKQLLDVSSEVELLFQIKHKTISSSQQSSKKIQRE
ncbi:cyclin-dependent protein kinase inhibitor SMR12 [Trifolium repens]|nr:cyclin-dependent protein kinase inhibitor SMR12 [Trifolium repens]